MATLTAAQQSATASALGNDDILHLLGLQLDTRSIAAMRLVNKRFKLHFTKYLFRTLRFRFSVWYIVRLTWVAANPEFAQNVREFVFDTATYQNFKEVDSVKYVGLGGLAKGTEARKKFDARMEAASRDEAMVLNPERGFINAVPSALKALSKCHKVVITSWSGPGSNFFTRGAIEGIGTWLPPPLAGLVLSDEQCQIQDHAGITMLSDLDKPFLPIEDLEICRSHHELLGTNAAVTQSPGMAISFDRGNHTMPAVNQSLRRLRLEIAMDDIVTQDSFKAAIWKNSLGPLWRAAANLRELDLEVRTNMAFDPAGKSKMWLEQGELAAFLRAHKGSLQVVRLVDLNVGDTEGYFKLMQHNLDRTFAPDTPHKKMSDLRGDISGKEMPWVERWADCEGFEGGERTPLGAKSRRTDQDNGASSNLDNFHSRPITWAVTEEQRQREYAVTALYPRLLYTFSDCVVFVLRNAKTFQSAVLTKLLEWGVAALESAINAPALSHCIVALNGTDPGVDEREWDVNYATQSLLSSVKTALDPVEGVPAFRALADHWRALGKQIFSVEDLILRYYSSFKVIRIPSKPRYMTIDTQIGQLHNMIKTNVEDSFRTKRRARMLTNADELDVYLQSGFDHFTTYLNVPFNFMKVSLLHHAIPNDFGGHILQLCTTISAKQPNHQPGRVAWMFEKLSVMLASCVLLDCARFRKGRVDELFGSYVKFFDYAMSEYLELHYPCSYVSSDGTRRCQLVKARHLPKGHQDERGIIATGDYEAAFDSTFLPLWKNQLRAAIADIQRDFQYELEQIAHGVEGQTIPEERIALGLHVEYLNTFFETIGSAGSIVSHATCFCCLMDVPEHPLPCGHVLCSACTKAYSRRLNGHSATMSSCPLHQYSTKWAKPALIKFKPTGAGVRVLSLDGGGIRGIVQLEVLRAMEQVIGGFIPIQSFFDLIVGSGYGGMLAVGLATRDKSVDQCIDQFSAICDHAFQPRMKGVPVVTSIVAALGSGRRYKTKPLYAALKTAFGESDHMFDAETQFRPGSKVALVSTSATGRESILLASYRRSEDSAPIYHFERPHEPEMELKIWQSVAASIAHPGHVKAFTFHGQTYLDGGLRCGNPAHIADRERQLIWPDASEPDLFLSLGTGQNRITVLQKLSDKVPNGTDAARKQSGRWRSKRLDDVLDAELAWTEFRSQAVRERSEAKGRRYIRFNPDLDKEPPAPDSTNDLVSLQNNVRKRLATPHRIAALRNVAHRLVASSFYLELQSKATAEQSEQICSASIVCRFEDGSAEMRGLGQILEDRMGEGFEPYFMIKPDMNRNEFIQKAPITKNITRALIDGGVFGLPNIYIPLRDESNATSITLFLQQHDGLEPDGFPISGFPRVLLGEPKQAQPTRKPVRASLDQRTRSEKLRSGHERGVSEVDTISLNGPDTGNNSSETSREDARDAGTSPASAVRKQSLAEIIAQHQLQGSSIKQRTNRFWTYIGNNHMAQHPEMYSEAELAKFASDPNNSTPTQTPRSAYPPVSHSPPATGLGIQTSLDPIDTAPQMQQVDGTSVFPPSRYRLTNPDPGTTYPYPSEAGTDHSGDDDGSVYSAHDMVIAEPVQVRVAPSPTLIRQNQSRPNTPKSSGSADTFRTAAATLSGAEVGASPPPRSEAETLKPTVFVQPAKARRTHRSLPSTVLAEDFPRPPSMAESEVRRSVASASKVSPPPSEATVKKSSSRPRTPMSRFASPRVTTPTSPRAVAPRSPGTRRPSTRKSSGRDTISSLLDEYE